MRAQSTLAVVVSAKEFLDGRFGAFLSLLDLLEGRRGWFMTRI
jgi:hypothetical protein